MYVFYMPSSLPLLHSAMLTPCLNAFWHSDLYIFLHFVGNVFCLVSVIFFGSLIFSEDRQFHAAAANGETRVNSTRFSRLWHKQPQKSTPNGEKRLLAAPEESLRTRRLGSHGSATWLLRLRMRTII